MTSKHPICVVNYYSGTHNEYQKLLVYKPNPERKGYINSILARITSGSVSYAQFRLDINGETLFKDKLLAADSLSLAFGGELEVGGKDNPEGVTLFVKSDGTNTITVHGALTGVEK